MVGGEVNCWSNLLHWRSAATVSDDTTAGQPETEESTTSPVCSYNEWDPLEVCEIKVALF